MSKAQREIGALLHSLERRGIAIPYADVCALRRIGMTLHRWAELECGDGNDYASWCISRDDDTGVPYMERHSHHGACTVTRSRIADREAGALKRLGAICQRLGLFYYHQTDPRGCALYVAKERLGDQNYSSAGVAIA